MHAISWEKTLLSWAYAALADRREFASPSIDDRRPATGDCPLPTDLLRTAYMHCEQITKRHSRTFYMASSLLPPAKRRAVRALYAFCRVSDDLVDCAADNPRQALEAWRAQTSGQWAGQWAGTMKDEGQRTKDEGQTQATTHYARRTTHYVSFAWADARLRYGVPELYAQQLLDGVALDLEVKRYATFEELAAYCYGVASTVGLMAMHIVGFSTVDAVPYAVKLGVALQLTNILRDVGEDWRAGRVYLPQEELEAFGLGEPDLQAGHERERGVGPALAKERWRRFMRFQIERNRRLYKEAWPGISMLSRDARPAIAAAAGLYRAILEDIERHDMDVFNRRAHLSTWQKLRRLPGAWLLKESLL
jgi:phytoene synthase